MAPAFETTCWTTIQAVAEGDNRDLGQFADRYIGPVRAYLMARWNRAEYRQLVDDAVQEVFAECCRSDGPLSRVDPKSTGSFRAYLLGVVRNIARRFEERQAAEAKRLGSDLYDLDCIVSDESTLSHAFDRAWARSIMQQARHRQMEMAQTAGKEAVRRVELLRLRFEEGRPLREIAVRWQVDRDTLYRQYRSARKEFRDALIHVVRFHHPGTDGEIEREAAELLQLLG